MEIKIDTRALVNKVNSKGKANKTYNFKKSPLVPYGMPFVGFKAHESLQRDLLMVDTLTALL